MKIDHTVHSYPKKQSIKEAVHRRSEHNFGNVIIVIIATVIVLITLNATFIV